MRPIALLSVLLAASLDHTVAQEQPLHQGQLVRVTCAEADLDDAEAVVTGVHEGSLWLKYERFRVDAHGRRHTDSVVTDVPIAAVTGLRVHAGTKSGATTGMLIGGTSMFFIGLISGAAYYSSDEEGAARYIVGGALVTGAIGVGLGWLIGSAVRSNRWEEVPLDRVQVGVIPTRGGLAVGVRVTF